MLISSKCIKYPQGNMHRPTSKTYICFPESSKDISVGVKKKVCLLEVIRVKLNPRYFFVFS